MNISGHVNELRKYMEFRKYSPRSVSNYCSSFTGFLAYFEEKGVTHPDRINHLMIKEFLSQFSEPATHSGYHSAIKIYYEKVAHVGIEKFKYIERPRKNKKLPIEGECEHKNTEYRSKSNCEMCLDCGELLN